MIKYGDTIALIGYCGLIYILSGRSSLPMPQFFSFQDKLHHAGAFFGMSLLAWRCFRHWITDSLVVQLLSVLFCSVYGATDEWHQSFVAGRHSDVWDWVADTLGAGLAMGGLAYFLRSAKVR